MIYRQRAGVHLLHMALHITCNNLQHFSFHPVSTCYFNEADGDISVKLSGRGAGLWKCLIQAFHHFLWPLFKNDQGRQSIPNVSPLA